MANTRDSKPRLEEASFFLIGDGGSGKTTLAGTFPKPYIFDFDRGVASISDRDVEYDLFKDAPHNGKAMPERGIYPYGTGWTKFLDRLNEIGAQIDKGTCPYETIVLDSATMMSTLCMNYVLKADSKSGKQPAIQNWGAQTSLMETVFDQLTSWPIIKIITAHIQRNTNDLMETKEMLPLLTGKFAAKSSIFFDEVYFMDIVMSKDSPPKRSYVLRTQSTPIMKQARSRFKVPDGTLAMFPAIEKAIRG